MKDRESNQPAQNISLTITEPRLEWLRALAGRRNTSVSGAVELLIDRARGTGDDDAPRVSVNEAAGDLLEAHGLPRPGASFPRAIRDPKAGVGPIPKKGSAK